MPMTIVSSMAVPHWRREASCLTARLSSSVSKAPSLWPGRHAYLPRVSQSRQQTQAHNNVQGKREHGTARRHVLALLQTELRLSRGADSRSLGPYLQEARDVEPPTGLQSLDRNQNLLEKLAFQSRWIRADQLLSQHLGGRGSRDNVVGALKAYGEALEGRGREGRGVGWV
jgi:hypothetical protein